MTNLKLRSIPELDFPWPNCPVCKDGSEMNYDGYTWYCGECGASWDRNGQPETITCDECKDEYEQYAKVDGRILCVGCAGNAHVEQVAR